MGTERPWKVLIEFVFCGQVAILQIWEIVEKRNFAEELECYEVSVSAVRKSFYRASNKFQNHKDFYLMKFRCAKHYSLEVSLSVDTIMLF